MEGKRDLVWAARVRDRLRAGSPADHEVLLGCLNRNIGSAGVPREAVLASVDNLVGGVVDGGRELRQLGVAVVDGRELIAGRVAEGSQDLVAVGPRNQQQGLRHLSGLTVRDATPAGASRADLATPLHTALTELVCTSRMLIPYQNANILVRVLFQGIGGKSHAESKCCRSWYGIGVIGVGEESPGAELDTSRLVRVCSHRLSGACL